MTWIVTWTFTYLFRTIKIVRILLNFYRNIWALAPSKHYRALNISSQIKNIDGWLSICLSLFKKALDSYSTSVRPQNKDNLQRVLSAI